MWVAFARAASDSKFPVNTKAYNKTMAHFVKVGPQMRCAAMKQFRRTCAVALCLAVVGCSFVSAAASATTVCAAGEVCVGRGCEQIDEHHEGFASGDASAQCKPIHSRLRSPPCPPCDLRDLKIVPQAQLVELCGEHEWKYCPSLVPTQCPMQILNRTSVRDMLLEAATRNRGWIAFTGDSLSRQAFFAHMLFLSGGKLSREAKFVAGASKGPQYNAFCCATVGNNCEARFVGGNVSVAAAINDLLENGNYGFCLSRESVLLPGQQLHDATLEYAKHKHKPLAIISNQGLWALFTENLNYIKLYHGVKQVAETCALIGKQHGIRCIYQGVTHAYHTAAEAAKYKHYRLPPFLFSYDQLIRQVWLEQQKESPTLRYIDMLSLTSNPKVFATLSDGRHYSSSTPYYQNLAVQLHYASVLGDACGHTTSA